MSRGFFGMLLVIVAVPSALAAGEPPTGANPAIVMQRYLIVASEPATAREAHRLSEQQFIEMSRLPGVVILDARSRPKSDELHVKGPTHLSYPDIASDSLQRPPPAKRAPIPMHLNQ